MNGTEFTIAIAIILFVAFSLGWFANWLVHRLTRVTPADLSELDAMAKAMHQAEEARDQAMAYMQEREAEMTSQLHQTEAELRATMDGLRTARAEADELREFVDRVNAQA